MGVGRRGKVMVLVKVVFGVADEAFATEAVIIRPLIVLVDCRSQCTSFPQNETSIDFLHFIDQLSSVTKWVRSCLIIP